jgi:prevent-host-death family protein
MVNVHEAKTHLSELLRRVEAGEEIVIARAGRPVARLVPHAEGDASPRTPGRWRGQVAMADDFDETPAELIALFDEGSVVPGEGTSRA